jgi:conjugation system TraG family ATPase
MEKWLKDVYPILAIEHDCLLSKSGDISVVYEVKLPEIFGLSDEDYEHIHQTWIKAIKALPENTVFHKQDWFLKNKYQGQFEKVEQDDFLSRSSERHFHERPVLEHSCYIILSKIADEKRINNSLWSTLIRPHMASRQSVNKKEWQSFLDKAGQFEQVLKDSGFIQLKRLKNEDLLSTADRPGFVEQYCFLSKGEHYPIVRDLELSNGIQVGNKKCQLFTLADANDLPSITGSRITYDKYSTDQSKFPIGFSSAIGLLLSCDHIYSQYILIGNTRNTLRQLEAKKLKLQSLANYSRENTISRDAVNDYLNEAISEQRTAVNAHFNILAWSDNEQELVDIKNSVASAFAQMEAVAKEERTGAGQLFWAGIPGNAGDLPRNDSFLSFLEQATCFLISESNARSSSSPFGMRLVERVSGAPVWVDLSDEMVRRGVCGNRNKVIIGSSGAGKSVFSCALHRAYYMSGAHCIIVDVGHSYYGLCRLLNGYYFTFDLKDPLRFNPFYIDEGDSLDTEKKESLKTLLVALWKRGDENYKRSEYVALSTAIHKYYEYLDQHTAVFPCFDSFYEWMRDTYSILLVAENVREKEFDLANFLYVLKPYYRGGEYDYLLNATERLDVFHQRFIVFELDSIKGHEILFSTVTLMIMDLFISKMRKLKGIRKVITIEEAWKCISNTGMASFMQFLVKTARKYFGEINTVSQEIDDLISSPIIRQALINNSDVKIILDIRKFQNRFKQIQEVMGMIDKGVPMVLSLNKANPANRKLRELYVDFAGQLMGVYAYEPSREEYWAFTTEEKEKHRVTEYTEKYGSVRKAIEAVVREELDQQKH